MNPQAKASICCITYNHAPFIAKCLDGFLLQKTDFAVEVLIHDDASTDGTQQIIKEYTDKYPDVFFPLLQNENQYSKGLRGMNARFNFPRASGKYIALCEGDDYWTDPLKLQKQVDYLDSHEDIVLTGHDFYLVDRNDNHLSNDSSAGNNNRYCFTYPKKGCSGIELQKCFGVLTLTMLFRKVADLGNMPKEALEVTNGDKFLISYLGQFGDYAFMNDIAPAAYRLHEAGVWSASSEVNRNDMMAFTYSKLRDYYKRIKNKPMALFHGRKAFYYSKKTLQAKLATEKNISRKVALIVSFSSANKLFTDPILFCRIVFIRIFKLVSR